MELSASAISSIVSFDFLEVPPAPKSVAAIKGVTHKLPPSPPWYETAYLGVYIDFFNQWQAYNGLPDIGMFNMETSADTIYFANDYLPDWERGMRKIADSKTGKEKAQMERNIAAGKKLMSEVALSTWIQRMYVGMAL